MFGTLNLFSLAWDEMDPARHPFNSAGATDVVYSLEPARHIPSRPDFATIADPDLRRRSMSDWSRDQAGPWVDAMSYALAEHYGQWTVGWRSSQGVPDPENGPVHRWSQGYDSIAAPEDLPAVIAAAVCNWREWLEKLAGWFDTYLSDPSAVEDNRVLWQRAVRGLIVQVVDRTDCESAWYGECELVLTWFMERWNVAPDDAKELVEEAIGGRFESWIAPDTALVADVAERVAASLSQVGGAPSREAAPDHLELWLVTRAKVPWAAAAHQPTQDRTTQSRDGVAENIRAFDGAIDPARARGLLAALDLMRSDAARGASLDFELLRGWQQHVLGIPNPPFRLQPAYAKGGRERYGVDGGTRDRLDACLAQSAVSGDNPLSLAARAARSYLDVCFFHPFDDGNARSAFLALLFVLGREDVQLKGVRLLRSVAFRADDPEDAVLLARMIETHVGNTFDV